MLIILILCVCMCETDMKKGMIDVGIFCKEPRFGLNTEKGKYLQPCINILDDFQSYVIWSQSNACVGYYGIRTDHNSNMSLQ